MGCVWDCGEGNLWVGGVSWGLGRVTSEWVGEYGVTGRVISGWVEANG